MYLIEQYIKVHNYAPVNVGERVGGGGGGGYQTYQGIMTSDLPM